MFVPPADIQECLRVAMIPESFLATEAHARSAAANISAEIAGFGGGLGGSHERRDSMAQQVRVALSRLWSDTDFLLLCIYSSCHPRSCFAANLPTC